MQDIIGFLIRYYRLQQNYSQEGLCKGICVVSYLSKIEQGQVQASSEIIHALFKVLNIRFYDDANLLNQGKNRMRDIIEKIFLEEEYEEDLKKITAFNFCVVT